jgi:ribose transport system substrate-binding protein
MFDSPMAWITGTQNTEDPRDFMKASFDRFEVDAAYRFGGALAKIATAFGACVFGTAAYAAGDSVTNHQSRSA